jgi:outer membrane lipoprotein SlyB
MTSRTLSIALLVLLSITGCARQASRSQSASRLTEAQRDTVIARSSLPGAETVGRALEVSGKDARHAAQVDSMTR